MKLCVRLSAVVALVVVVAMSALATPNSIGAIGSSTTSSTTTENPVSTDASFQVRYASNLDIGESYVNITNSGASIKTTKSSTSNGNICVNVYAFDPNEEMIACCSCRVTPDGLVSLGVNRDITVNPLTGAIPSSVVIKLLATQPPSSGNCNAAAPGATAPGLAAWGTTLHPTPVPGTYALTETAFTPATLSPGELTNLGSTCTFIENTGSGFGICNSCRVGGLVVPK